MLTNNLGFSWKDKIIAITIIRIIILWLKIKTKNTKIKDFYKLVWLISEMGDKNMVRQVNSMICWSKISIVVFLIHNFKRIISRKHSCNTEIWLKCLAINLLFYKKQLIMLMLIVAMAGEILCLICKVIVLLVERKSIKQQSIIRLVTIWLWIGLNRLIHIFNEMDKYKKLICCSRSILVRLEWI